VLALAAVLFLWNLGGYDLWAPDEPYFGEGAREMVEDGHWIVPHVNGAVTTDKPPLFFWAIALLSWVAGGVSSWTARLPSALAALATVALTLRLGRRLWGPREGALAGLVLTVSFMVWDKARSAQIDALLCALIATALSAFELWRAGEARGSSAGLLFWAAAGLAVLAKGPVGLLLPLGIALATLALDRRLRAWRDFAPVTGPAVFAAVTGAWVAATLLWGGDYSVWGALREHFVDRAVHGMHHVQPLWYYAGVLPVYLMPWSALLPPAVLAAGRRWSPGDRFLLVWVGFVVLFFSVSTEKRDLYVLPAFPGFALLVARLLSAPPRPRTAARAQVVNGFLLAAAGIALPLAAARVDGLPSAAGAAAIPVAVAFAGGGVAVALVAWRRGAPASALATVGAVGLAYVALAGWAFPALEPIKSARPFARAVARETAGAPVLAFDLGNLPEAIAFYSDGVYLQETHDPAVVARHLQGAHPGWVATDASRRGELPDSLIAVASHRTARRTVLLLRRPPLGTSPAARGSGSP
jgi:4-amino-4-deoxy-L-arabinose transferase-like glycosyltransferase